MNILGCFLNKSLSLLRLGTNWFARLLGAIAEASRTISYVETVAPSQADSLHQAIKSSDIRIFRHEFELSVRKALSALRFGRVRVGVDVTEEPYWGKEGHCNTRAKVHEKSDESFQFVNLAIVEPRFIPLMSLPYRQVDDLDSLVIDLLEYLRTLPLRVRLVMFDRGFYHWELIDYLENRRGGKPWPYLIFVPKNDAMKEYISQTKGKLGVFRHQNKYAKAKSTWQPETKIVICKGVGKNRKGKPIDWCFATNQKPELGLVWTYRKRWNHETGFRIQDEAKIKTKSSNPLIRFFYHLLSMLLILIWRVKNRLSAYITFKRFIKCIEMHYIAQVKKPPPGVTAGYMLD